MPVFRAFACMKFAEFLRSFYRFSPREVLGIGVLNICTAFTESIGLMLLIPMLGLVGMTGQGSDLPVWLQPLGRLLNAISREYQLPVVLTCFILLIAIQSSLALLRERRSQSLQMRFIDHLRQRLFAAIAGSRWNYLTQRHSSELLSVLTNDIDRIGSGVFFLIQLAGATLLTLAYLAVALQLSAPLTGLSLIIGLVLWAILRRSREAAKESGEILSHAYASMFSHLQEFLAALKLIKIHAEEDASVGQYQRSLAHVRLQHMEFLRTHSRVALVYRLGGAISLAIVAWLALTQSGLAPASLLVLVAIFSRMLPQLSQLQTGVAELWNMLPAFDNWSRQLARCESHQEDRHDEKPLPLEASIVLEGVIYQHHQSHHTLRVDNLSIPARKTTAILGPSGGGKSTLLDVLSGLHPPQAGRVLVDGQALPPGHRGWRRGIAYVPQETVILDGTVRENLAWGNEALTEADLWAALKQAAGDFVRQLPQGLETTVGERGIRLSGGERQRLALARAILRYPQLLILDEATSALDQDNQRIILEAIKGLHGRMTVLIVTHRHLELGNLIDGHISVDAGVVGPWEPTTTSRNVR